MLSYQKSITLNGKSMIDKESAEEYSATINSENPEDITFSSWQTDKALYKANRTQCRQDQAEFEDIAYALQDEMITAATAAE